MLPQQIHFKPQRWPHPVAMIMLLHTDGYVGLHSYTPVDNWIAVWMGLAVKKKILPQLGIKVQSFRQQISFDPAS